MFAPPFTIRLFLRLARRERDGSGPQWQRFSTSNHIHSKICFSATSQAVFETVASAPFIRLSRRRRLLRHRRLVAQTSPQPPQETVRLPSSFSDPSSMRHFMQRFPCSGRLQSLCSRYVIKCFWISQGKSSFTIPISGLVEIWS